MPRPLRLFLPGVPHHVIQRGTNRDLIFRDATDYSRLIELLREGLDRYQCAIHAYALMTNHVHLLVTPNEPSGISRLMQYVGGEYVPSYNRRHLRTGALWQGRFRSNAVMTERYLLTCCRYIEANPVRAGMVSHPSDYQWSSYRCNALGQPDALVSPHSVYERLGRTTEERRLAYLELFRETVDPVSLQLIRAAVQRGAILRDEGLSIAGVRQTTHRTVSIALQSSF